MWNAIKTTVLAVWNSLTWAISVAGKQIILFYLMTIVIGWVAIYGAQRGCWEMPEVKYELVIKTTWVMKDIKAVPMPVSHWWPPGASGNKFPEMFTLQVGETQPVEYNSLEELNSKLEKYGREVVAIQTKSPPPVFAAGLKVLSGTVTTLWEKISP